MLKGTFHLVVPLILGIGNATMAFCDAPVLTGLTRHAGQIRAFFETPDRQTRFALGLRGEWGGYRLVSVDFTNRLAVVEEGKQTYTTHFGNAATESTTDASSSTLNVPIRLASPFTPEEDEYRARNGQAAFAKWQRERLLQKIEAESAPDRGVIRPEIIAEEVHP